MKIKNHSILWNSGLSLLAFGFATSFAPAQEIIFNDTFDAEERFSELNEDDGLYYVYEVSDGYQARQSAGSVTSTYTELVGSQIVFREDGAKVLERTTEGMITDTNFQPHLGDSVFTFSFDLKMVRTTSNWTNISLVDANTSVFDTALSLFVYGAPNGATLMQVRTGTGANQTISPTMLNELFGSTFNVNEWHNYRFVVRPTSGLSGTWDFFIDDVLILENIMYFFTEETTRMIRWDTQATKAHFDNLTLSLGESVVAPPTWAGYEILENGDVDTGDWLGMLRIYPESSFVYSYEIGRFIYLPEEWVQENGAWVNVLRY